MHGTTLGIEIDLNRSHALNYTPGFELWYVSLKGTSHYLATAFIILFSL